MQHAAHVMHGRRRQAFAALTSVEHLQVLRRRLAQRHMTESCHQVAHVGAIASVGADADLRLHALVPARQALFDRLALIQHRHALVHVVQGLIELVTRLSVCFAHQRPSGAVW
jgi:hypothetical protein